MSGRNFITAAISTAGFILSAPATRTTTVTGAAVDILNVDGPMLVVQHVGTVTGTTPTLDGKLQDSADGSTGWADITGATFTQVTASDNLQAIKLEASEVKRYVRYVGTIAGTTPSFPMSISAWGRKASV
ncbi:MAG TPA: hypothetical protein PLV92_09075 [Pirellulaceae bacterium]|nr:hypothetical protein [Pirellulaceae bacterium]